MLSQLKHNAFIGFIKFAVRFAPGASQSLYCGEGSSAHLCRHVARLGLKKALVVSDRQLVEAGVVQSATGSLAGSGVEIVLFDAVVPDPSFGIVDQGIAVYRDKQCDCIIAVGGGSSIDAAKVIGVGLAHTGSPRDYTGFGKANQALPPLFAIPTTSGTGSEATMGAVITDEVSHSKEIISGHPLLPVAACLDPLLLTGLPPGITAATGMDALTHAIEAYIGTWDREDCQQKASVAVRLVFENLQTCFSEGNNVEARDAMAYASYAAGQAVNLVNVGNVHAIAHQVGALYGVPHGLANAVLLPHVLRMSLPRAAQRLEELAALLGRKTADDFIEAVCELNRALNIPQTLAQIQAKDVPELAARAVREADGYPVPHLMDQSDAEQVLHVARGD